MVLKLVGGLSSADHSVGSKDSPGHLLDLNLLDGHHVNKVLSVLGASEGRGVSVLFPHVKLLDLSFHAVHHHGTLLRVVVVVLENVYSC